LVSLEHFRDIEFGPDMVTIGAGVRYGDLCAELHARGFALHNLASLPHISVAGACATATHGSGDKNGNLATAVVGIEIVTADGDIKTFTGESGVVVNLGSLGIVTRVTLRLVPAFEVAQTVYQHLPLSRLEPNFGAVMSSAYSVSLFTDWQNSTINQVWQKRRVNDAPALNLESLGATRATRNLHPIENLSAVHCTQQLGVAGPWHERLPHFRMEFTPSSGEELQSEYFVPRPHAIDAIRAIDQVSQYISPHLQISEIRSIAADKLWMSPCYQQACIAIHFTWKKDWPAVREVLPRIEAALEPLSARPHWGKLFTMPPSRLQSLYRKLPEFRELLRRLDPAGKFRNAFLESAIN
jgi:xylitol oxidase